MDNYVNFKSLKSEISNSFESSIQNKPKKKDFDLGYGMVFVSSEDKMNDFADK